MKTFWYPEKPKRIYSFSKVPKNYIFQIKKDGWRIIINAMDGFTLHNREGSLITCTKSENWEWLKDIFGEGFYLDGEVIGRRQGEVIDTIVIWDILYHKGQALHKWNYMKRYDILYAYLTMYLSELHGKIFGTDMIGQQNGMTLLLSKNYDLSDFKAVWKVLEFDNKYDEGVVFKNPNSPLKWSLNSNEHTFNQLKLKIRE
jgi:ATP-dependent DNA ligase